jgi:hypothetical protein
VVRRNVGHAPLLAEKKEGELVQRQGVADLLSLQMQEWRVTDARQKQVNRAPELQLAEGRPTTTLTML